MTAATTTVISEALDAAVRAPSPFNTQPWLFDVAGSEITLRLDRTRLLANADPEAHEARLACGAALCNLRLKLHDLGRVGFVDLNPTSADPDVLAVVRVAGERTPTAVERRLAAAIPKRHTNRHPFLDRKVPESACRALCDAARAEGARLVIVAASERYDQVIRLVREAELAQDANGAYQHEIKKWLSGANDRMDGIPVSASGPAPVSGRLLAMRTFYRQTDLPPRLFEQQPLLAAVTTKGCSCRYHDVVAGKGMQRALLTGYTLGLACSFVSQPFEVARTREEITKVFAGDGVIHTLLRIGYGYPVGPTPRRPIDEVTIKH